METTELESVTGPVGGGLSPKKGKHPAEAECFWWTFLVQIRTCDIFTGDGLGAVFVVEGQDDSIIVRQDILESENRDEWRDLDVTYIFGPTATGKSRGVMEKHGYAEVCRIVDYKHPFEGYMAQSVICFDEFRSSLPVGDMLEYLDGYPIALPARYTNRQALYTTVYIISNIDLGQQFPKVQEQELATWRAFLRRIHHVVEYRKDGPPINHGPALD